MSKIPKKMQKGNIHRCIIRIAKDKSIYENLKNLDNVITKENIRVARKMRVEVTSNEYFEIQILNNLEQVIENESYTEWNFNVKPLQLGEFPLTFKVSIILLDGIKEVVVDESIKVVVEPVKESLIKWKEKLILLTMSNEMENTNTNQLTKWLGGVLGTALITVIGYFGFTSIPTELDTNKSYSIQSTFEFSDDESPIIGKYVSLYTEKGLFLDSVKTDNGGTASFSKLLLQQENYVVVKIKSLNFTEREYIGDKKDNQNIVLDKNIIDKKQL